MFASTVQVTLFMCFLYVFHNKRINAIISRLELLVRLAFYTHCPKGKANQQFTHFPKVKVDHKHTESDPRDLH